MPPLSRYIVRARERRGWSRAELARTSSMPYTTLRNLEAAERNVHTSEANLKLLANALGETDRDRKDMFEQMRVLAGYMIIASKDANERDQRFLANVDTYPELRSALERLLERGDAEEIDRAHTALEVARRLKVPR